MLLLLLFSRAQNKLKKNNNNKNKKLQFKRYPGIHNAVVTATKTVVRQPAVKSHTNSISLENNNNKSKIRKQ